MSDAVGTFGAGAKFYRHSGIVPGKAGARALAAAVGSGLVGGAAFGYLELYAHLIPATKLMGILIMLGMVALGMVVGIVPTMMMKKHHGRSVPAAMFVATVGWAVGMYAAWAMWIFALGQYTQAHVSLARAWRPDVLVRVIAKLNQEGVWFIGTNDKPSGWFLALLWLVEAGVVLGMAWVMARTGMGESVYCEQCGRWGEKRPLMQIMGDNAAGLGKELKAGRVEALAGTKKWNGLSPTWCDVTLEGCSQCDSLQTLTLESCTLNSKKKGKDSLKKKVLVRRLVMTPEQTLQAVQAAATVSASGG